MGVAAGRFAEKTIAMCFSLKLNNIVERWSAEAWASESVVVYLSTIGEGFKGVLEKTGVGLGESRGLGGIMEPR